MFIHLGVYPGVSIGVGFRVALGRHHFLTLQLISVGLQKFVISLQLSAMDPSAQVTMKDAAKCDRRCEWQNSANQ